MTRPIRAWTFGTFAALWVLSAHAASTLPDWKNFADLETIQVVTLDDHDDANGQPIRRETTIWLAVHEGHAYIRTGATTWGANLERDSNLILIMNGIHYALSVTPIPQGALYDAVKQTFRDKYGFMDAAIGLFRGIGGTPTIMRLDGRPGIPMGN
jgi:hypothetical protein